VVIARELLARSRESIRSNDPGIPRINLSIMLAECWHACPACGLSAPRDVVSAQVILQPAPDRAFAA